MTPGVQREAAGLVLAAGAFSFVEMQGPPVR